MRTKPAAGEAPRLTPMEMKVLRLMCDCRCLLEKAMPGELGISLSTFKTHREHLYAKLGVHDRLELMHCAVQLRLVPCFCQVASEPVPPLALAPH
jgi:DNA-binding CsgD family transcriptional regulator